MGNPISLFGSLSMKRKISSSSHLNDELQDLKKSDDYLKINELLPKVSGNSNHQECVRVNTASDKIADLQMKSDEEKMSLNKSQAESCHNTVESFDEKKSLNNSQAESCHNTVEGFDVKKSLNNTQAESCLNTVEGFDEKMSLNNSQAESYRNTVESFNSTEKSKNSVFDSETLKNDGLQKNGTSKTINDVCQRGMPEEKKFDATQMSSSENCETGNYFSKEPGSESAHPDVKSLNISFESKEKQNAVHTLKNTAKNSPVPPMSFDQIEGESSHFEIKSCDIFFQSEEEEEEEVSLKSEVIEKKGIREMRENRHGRKKTFIDGSRQEIRALPAKQNQLPIHGQSLNESMDNEPNKKSLPGLRKTSTKTEYELEIPLKACQTEAPLDTLQISDIEGSAISQTKHREKEHSNPADVVQTKEDFIFEILSKKKNSLRNENDSSRSEGSSWRHGSSVSDDSYSDSEPSIVHESHNVKLGNEEKPTMQWLSDIDEKLKTSDAQKPDKGCLQFVSNPGRLSLAPDQSDLCLRFDNLKLEIFNKPSFLNVKLTGKRRGCNLEGTQIKTIGRDSELELSASANVSNKNNNQKATESTALKKVETNLHNLPSTVKTKVVKKGKPRKIQNTPETKVDLGEMQNSVMHQSKPRHRHNQSTPKKGITQIGIETHAEHPLEIEGIFFNNQSTTSFQNNKTHYAPLTLMRANLPEHSDLTGIAKPNSDCESENHQLDAIETNPPASFAITGGPNVLDEENRDLAAAREISNSMESLVDSLNSFHLSNDQKFVAKNKSEKFCFQNKNFKMTFQPDSNLDNFKLLYESSSSRSALELESNDRKLVLEIENN
ncbi:enolase-phosphatase E1-like isoform X2 [Parasteatoda tepidariorum]|uniref:enolase-phosphatase E1-like isoform X2 n=1 Tax=Parasteatoda tepidariorum TaxID=114398 RepID=UPI0039BD5B8E